jgi:hypothetical protein
MNHIGNYPGPFHINAYGARENKLFTCDNTTLFNHMFAALHNFYADRKPPRPYEAILEQHRALAATNVSRLTGQAVRLDSLGGTDEVPYCESIRRWVVRNYLKRKS